MSLFRKSIKGAVKLSVGQALNYGCSFLRLAILARLLSREDFGIAATFAITIATLEMVGNIAINRLIVQSENGDRPDFQATLQLVEVCRGLTNAALLFVLAWPASRFFGVPEARWAFHCLAIVPLVRGFMHLDIHRQEREMNFGPRIVVEVVPQVLVTLAAWPMAVWLQDYSVILWLLIARATIHVLSSHLIAKRPYRCKWEGAHRAEILKFGWPLMLNAILIYLVSQGDRVAIAGRYDMELLAIYTAAATLALAPVFIVGSMIASVILPLLSRFQAEPARFRQVYGSCREVLTVVSGWTSGIMIILAGVLPVIVFGEKYASAGPIIVPLAIAAGLRMIRSGCSTAAMSLGDTKITLYANMVRSGGLALTVAVVVAGQPIVWAAWTVALAESVALVAANTSLWLRHRAMAPVPLGRPEAVWGAAIAAVYLFQSAFAGKGILLTTFFVCVFSVLWLGVSCGLFPAIRGHAYVSIQFLVARFRHPRYPVQRAEEGTEELQ